MNVKTFAALKACRSILKRSAVFMLCAAAVLFAMPVQHASALSAGIYTGSVTTTYYNPDTGEVDDGGTANAALGEGMCRSATGTTALVECDGKSTWVTIRLLLQSNCSNVAFYTRSGYNSYSKVNYSVMQEDSGNDSIDYRFKVSDAGVKIKGTMYVAPMGRNVLWYLYVNTGSLKSGSGDFVTSIDLSSAAASASASSGSGNHSASSSSSSHSQSAATSSAGQTSGNKASASSGNSAAVQADENASKSDSADEKADEINDEDAAEDQNEDENAQELSENTDELSSEEEAPDENGAEDDANADDERSADKNSDSSGGALKVAVPAVIVIIIAVCAAVFFKKKNGRKN